MIALPAGVSIVLASASPRRRSLLDEAGLAVTVQPADIDETPHVGEKPIEYVRRLSAEKAAAIPGGAARVVVAADTTVEIDGAILEKPLDRSDAARMLRLLSGRDHRCHTGVTVASVHGANTRVVTTVVTFIDLDDEMIDWYLGTGEADDKAGAYGIQGAAGAFVERVEGSVTNVIGLPMAETLAMLRVVAET